MRQREEGEAAGRGPTRVEDTEGAARPEGDASDPSLPTLQADLPVYSASPDDGDDRSSGVWPGVGADDLLREDAQHLANIAGVSADEVQRELGVVSRTREGDIRRNEIQMAEVLRTDGSVRAGPPVSNKYHRQKEEEAWLHTSTTGAPSRTPSSLMEGLTRTTPSFGYAVVARVEGSVASPPRTSMPWTLSRVEPDGSKRRLSRRKRSFMTRGAYRLTTYDMARNAEMDVFDFHKLINQPTPFRPAVPTEAIVLLRADLLNEELDELHEGLMSGDLVAIADGIIDTVYVLVGMAIAYGLPFSDLWDEVHANNMTKGGGAVRDDGKAMKPDDFVGPDIEGVLKGTVRD